MARCTSGLRLPETVIAIGRMACGVMSVMNLADLISTEPFIQPFTLKTYVSTLSALIWSFASALFPSVVQQLFW
jgi:hypothetical protein